MRAYLQQMIGRSHRGTRCDQCFMRVGARHDQLVPMAACMRRSEQKPTCGPKLASQTQLAVEFGCVVDPRSCRCRLDLLRSDQDAPCNRPIEAANFFRKTGGREIPRDTAGEKLVAGVEQSGALIFLAFLDHRFGQPDDAKHWQPASQIYFDLHEGRVQPDLSAASYPGERQSLIVHPESIHGDLRIEILSWR